MALDLMIPEIWSNQLLLELKKRLVFGQGGIANRNYQGEISRYGDRVHIHGHGDIDIFDYTKNTDLPAMQVLEAERRTLVVDQAKAFRFYVDDIDQAQTQPKVMQSAMSDAAYRLADLADQFNASHYTDVDAGNQLGTVTDDDVYQILVDLGVVLDEANVPREGRFAVLPPFAHGKLQSDDRFVATGDNAAADTRLNGQVGRAAGMTILVSNNTPVIDGDPDPDRHVVVAGYNGAYSYVEQINSVESFRPEDRFGDAVKGLHLYGGSLVRPDGWATAEVTRS